MDNKIYLLCFFMIYLIPSIYASSGDRSPFYQKCLKKCKKLNCTSDADFTEEAAALRDTSCKVVMWDCHDECRYHCMWRTVNVFNENGYDLPKFHGKWPFKRVMCLQEPTSVFASFLNLASTMYMHKEIWMTFRVTEAPMVPFWHMFIMVCELAWVWSMIFHARDTLLTEFMDYSLALAMVMMLFVSAVVRLLYEHRLLRVVLVLPLVSYYVAHVIYLHEGRVDYDYNMKVNVFFGVSAGLLWLGWCWQQYRRGLSYPWRLLLFCVWSGSALTLELVDGPPLLGWDTHALWHLSTAPLPLLFYKFVIEDVKHLQIKQKEREIKTL
ncbi:hypothetical protein KGM_205932 [Danaus plexippus plexippus]|uniref:Post-GPI attachment to proteins factor 3 n=1 Tax=Danaus plexippus plexippus TaxID=278856 RepID=A0A212FNX3_DANPL|nr:hypothetical protein KGM_205932 [Danaus plexippus plexippus]